MSEPIFRICHFGVFLVSYKSQYKYELPIKYNCQRGMSAFWSAENRVDPHDPILVFISVARVVQGRE